MPQYLTVAQMTETQGKVSLQNILTEQICGSPLFLKCWTLLLIA